MANHRHPPRKPLSNPTPRYGSLARRKYQLRHSPRSRKQVLLKETDISHGFLVSSPASRPVLVPLHLNLRRLPSRLMAIARGRDSSTQVSSDVKIGMKRKRVASVNENTFPSRSSRPTGGFKRQRSQNSSSSDDAASSHGEMEVDDDQHPCWMSDTSELEEQGLDKSEDYLIHQAGSRQLNRLRKDDLLRLHDLAGLSDLDEDSTKSDIINAIISSRNDGNELPPSSPPGRTDGHSSGYSSDEGHDGGGEETDAHSTLKSPLRRRVTVQEIGRQLTRPGAVGRTFSLDFGVTANRMGSFNKKSARISKDVKSPVHHTYNTASTRRRGTSSQSSPTNSSVSTALPSPPTTRLRSRTISTESTNRSASASLASSSSLRNKGTSISTGSKRSNRSKHVDFGSSIHEGDEVFLIGQTHQPSNPSPRRLRSKKRLDSLSPTPQNIKNDLNGLQKRVTPMRKAKGRVGSLKEESTASEGEEDELSEKEEDEVDELDSSPSPSGSPEPQQRVVREQRTPLRKRLRPRKVQTLTPPSDGDDEEEEDEDVETVMDRGEEDVEDLDEESDEEEEEDEEDAEEVLNEVVVEPRVLRNGKVVGEEIADGAEDEDEESSQLSEIEIDQEESDSIGDGEDQVEEEDQAMEDEFDLSSATQKTLIRLRRDDLVRLCEARELDIEGTKPQLAQALLEWRDKSTDMTPAPSSSSTARPPSTTKANGRRRRTRSKSKSSSGTPPVLLRSGRFHDDEPVTPPVSKDKKDKDEGDLELDLESLGLEDREIPPEKLTKLEKIGSGGFKDVFIGKLKGRKVAIAEFRDQLSAMDIKELKLLAEFAHPNIVRFLGVSIPENTKETPVMIISELCSNGDLFDYIRNVPAPSLYKVLNMMLDVARGLQYLHERKPSVIHRDCKSSNILITSKGTAKIADFGLAKVKQSTRSMVRSLVGTVNWQAPELWVPHPKYNHKVDVFSCACVYWEMLQWHIPTKKFPWEGMNEHAIYEAVGQKRQRPSVSGLRKQWCPEIVDLIERMWAQDPSDRPGIVEVVEELQRIVKLYR